MKVFKFGGSVLKDAQSFPRLLQILKQNQLDKQLLVVISAMDKTTNALELVLQNYWQKKDFMPHLDNVKQFHLNVAKELFPEVEAEVYAALEQAFTDLKLKLEASRSWHNYDRLYDKVVSFGEIFSSLLVYHYLKQSSLPCQWLDARAYITTDSEWREAQVDWSATEENIQSQVLPLLKQNIVITQGFIAGNRNGETLTLGREGSDFSAAIFATCLGAKELTIWKDVSGILNADPKKVPDAQLYEHLSYQEAAEMSNYGATVIHPKTIAPLAQKRIKLYIKPFLHPQSQGTLISSLPSHSFQPSIIYRDNQVLIWMEVQPFIFLAAAHLVDVLQALDRHHVKVHFVYKTASRLGICTDDHPHRLAQFFASLPKVLEVSEEKPVQLITIKNANEARLRRIMFDKKIILESRNQLLYQAIVSL